MSRSKKVFKIIGNILFYMLMTIFGMLILCGLYSKITQKQPLNLFGVSSYVVVSKSMSEVNPENEEFLAGHDDRLQVGDLVFTKKIESEEDVDVYSIVTFQDGAGNVIIHRIVRIEEVGGVKYYTTRGDRNASDDSTKTLSQLTGVLTGNWGQIGRFVAFVGSIYGIITFGGLVLVFVFGDIFIREWRKQKQEKS